MQVSERNGYRLIEAYAVDGHTLGQRAPAEVKSHSSVDRFLIVFHSPGGMTETGLLACPPEKTARVSERDADTEDFSGPV